MAMTADELASKTASITGSSEYDTKAQRNRALFSGAIVGGLAGLYYSYSKKKNMLVYTGAGVVCGAIVSRMLMPKD